MHDGEEHLSDRSERGHAKTSEESQKGREGFGSGERAEEVSLFIFFAVVVGVFRENVEI